MFENEGTEIESTQSDVVDESSSDSQDSSQVAQQAAAPKEENLPFHEHPRWKEVMEERNAERTRAQALEQRLADMDRRYQELSRPRSEPKKDALVDRLTGIDEDFGRRFGEIAKQAELATQLQEQLNAFKEERVVESLKGKFEELASKNSLDPTDKELYFSKLDLAYRQGKLRSPADVEAQFKAIHEPQAKRMEAYKRAAIEEYTKAKKADATRPTGQPKGKAPSAGKVDFSKMSQQEAKAFLNKQIVTQLRAGRET
jgi:hypothetical protein